jgi:hypothetical protein
VRISDFRGETSAGRTVLSATIVWEDSDRPPFEMRFASDEDTLAGGPPDPHAFLLAAAVPAWRRGERRIAIDGAVCPRLRDGLRAAQGILAGWFAPGRPPIPIEASGGFRPYAERSPAAAVFLTGGIDSLHVLARNRRFHEASHPAFFREAIYADRLAYVEDVPSPRALDLTGRQGRAIGEIARECGLRLRRVDSNFRLLDPDQWWVASEDQGALLAATGHALTRRIGSVSLAATHDPDFLPNWGTHPLLDPCYSSSGLEFRHEGFGRTRFEKTAEIAGWDVARKYLLVCFDGPLPPGQLNCGKCEKCLRTMTALLALGVLSDFRLFGGAKVTPEKIAAMPFGNHMEFFGGFWAPLVEPLVVRGETGIARVLKEKLAAWRQVIAWHEGTGWRGRLRRIDRDYLGGALLRVSRELRRRVRGSAS